jgi:hypothetical protein
MAMARVALIAALILGTVAAPASAATRIAYGGSSAWTTYWPTTTFRPGTSHINIWTTCRPRVTGTKVTLIVRNRRDGSERRYHPPCDRQGHWIWGVPVAATANHIVDTHIYDGEATGWTSVYR